MTRDAVVHFIGTLMKSMSICYIRDPFGTKECAPLSAVCSQKHVRPNAISALLKYLKLFLQEPSSPRDDNFQNHVTKTHFPKHNFTQPRVTVQCIYARLSSIETLMIGTQISCLNTAPAAVVFQSWWLS